MRAPDGAADVASPVITPAMNFWLSFTCTTNIINTSVTMSVMNKYTSEMRSMAKMMRNKMRLSKSDTKTDVPIQKTNIFAGVKPKDETSRISSFTNLSLTSSSCQSKKMKTHVCKIDPQEKCNGNDDGLIDDW
jgi:hypothetical protein